MRSLFSDCAVIDIWRYLHPQHCAFSWMRSDGSLSSCTDFFDCLYVWAYAVESCDLLPCPFSDHCAVSLVCPIPEPVPRGPGRWKLNTSILSDQSFKDSVSSLWLGWKKRKSSFETIQEWWDVGKSKLKGLAIRFCASTAKTRSLEGLLMTNLSSHLKIQLDQGHITLLDIYEPTLDSLPAEGAQIWSSTC